VRQAAARPREPEKRTETVRTTETGNSQVKTLFSDNFAGQRITPNRHGMAEVTGSIPVGSTGNPAGHEALARGNRLERAPNGSEGLRRFSP
jgi:hypothetical protein